MEDKKQDVNSLKELVKTADSYGAFFANLADEISKVLADIKAPKQEDTWEMKYPYKDEGEYWFIYDNVVDVERWDDTSLDKDRFDAGNVFPTEEAALLEVKRRNLLTRFKAFRDECNGDWKADWNDCNSKKWVIVVNDEKEINAMWTFGLNAFSYFGCFKNQFDAERAITLFGQKIIELYVDNEV